MKIGFIGLGAMGMPMARNVLKAGHRVTVYDVDSNKIEIMQKEGAKKAETIADLAEHSEMILISLPNEEILEKVLVGAEQAIQSCNRGTIIVDLSSVSPQASEMMAQEAAKFQLGYLDAPVSGGVKGAEAGTLTIMVGGAEDVFHKAKPILEIIGKKIYHVGPIGTGDAIKIVNNLLLGCHMAALAEALVLGAKCGLDPELMYEIISASSGNSYVLHAKMKQYILQNQYEEGFAVDLQYKDLNLAKQTADDHHISMPMTTEAINIYDMARNQGLGHKDISSIIKVLEKLSGVKVV